MGQPFVDDCHTGGLQPRETTSLWRVKANGEIRVAAIDELPQNTSHLQHNTDAKSSNIYDGSWAVNVQLVKRDGNYRLLVDGMETAPDADGMTVLLAHRGMLTNLTTAVDSPVSILSPCAVSVFVEDGQRPPRRCTVEVVQGATGVSGKPIAGKETKLAEREFNHTSVADNSSNVVVVPYPTKYPRHGRIAIYDLAKVYKAEDKRLNEALAQFGGTVATAGAELLMVPAGSGAALSFSAIAPSISFLALAFTFIGSAPTGSVLGALAAAVSTSELQAKFLAAPLTGLLGAMVTGFTNWIKKPAIPASTRVSFTINEFADALERLSQTVDLQTPEELEEVSKTSKFKREILVFKWMLEAEEDGTVFGKGFTALNKRLTGRDRGRLKPNPADLSELEVSTNVSMFSQIEVVVEDDEICGAPYRAKLRADFGEDERRVAALAIGTLRSISRLEAAIQKFQTSLTDAINSRDEDALRHFFAANMIAPILKFFQGRNLIPKDKEKESLKSLGVQSKTILIAVNRNFSAKFTKNFTDTESVVQKYKKELEKTAANLFSQKLGDGGSGDTLVRFLPHATELALFFPGARAADIDYAENDEEDSSLQVRQISAFSDSCKVYTDMARSARNLLTDMKDELVAVDFRHGYRGPSSGEFGRLLQANVESNALNIHAPLSIVHAIDTEALSESIRLRLEAITSSASSGTAKTALEAIGLPNTYHAFHAVSIVAELLAEELVASGSASDRIHDISVLNQGPFQSALQRAVNARALIQSHIKNTKSTLLVDRSRLLGTRTGRDAARIVDSMHIDSLERLQVRVGVLTAMLAALNQTVQRLLSLQDGPLAIASRLPSEPLASLFQDKSYGMDAFLRVSTLVANAELNPESPSVARLLWSVASSYASNQLIAVSDQADSLPALTRPPSDAMACEEAVQRMARLRVDVEMSSMYRFYATSDTAVTGAQAMDDAIKELAGELSNVTFDPPTKALFYVPFAYGGKPWALKRPAGPPCLIGSVPVWCDDIRWGMERVRSFMTRSEAEAVTQKIRFVYKPCALNNESVQRILESPLFVAVEQTKALDEAVVYGAVPRPRPPRDKEAESKTPASKTPRKMIQALTPRFGYRDHAQDQAFASLNESISDVVWNADRIVQAAMAMLHVCQPDDDTIIHVELLPDLPKEDAVNDDTLQERSNALLWERFRVVEKAQQLFFDMQDLAALAEEIGPEIVADEVLQQTVATGAGNVGNSTEYASNVLGATNVGTDEDALDLASNAVQLLAMFKEGYPKLESWGNPGIRDVFSRIAQDEEYRNPSNSLDGAAVSLKESFDKFKQMREQELQRILDRMKLDVENTRRVANRTAECVVISSVIASATLSRIVGRSRANIALVGFDHWLLEDGFKSRVRSFLKSTIRVAGDDAPDQDVAKLSEVCGIMLSLF